MTGLVLLVLGGLVLTLGDIVMKEWIINNSYYWYSSGIVMYTLGLNFLAQSFRYKNISVASVLLVIFNVITLTLVSFFFFSEKITIQKIIGIALGLISVIILEMN